MLRQRLRDSSVPEPTPSVLALMLESVLSQSLYLSLHSSDPGDDGANEVVGGAYQQQLVDFEVMHSLSPEARSEELVQFSNMPAVVLTHLGLWDADGIFLWSGEIVNESNEPVALRVFAGDRVEFPIGDLVAMFET